MPGSKYTMEFQVSGDAEAALSRIEHGLSEVHAQAGHMKEGLERAGDGMEKIFNLELISKGIELFEEMGEKIKEIAIEVGELTKEFLHTAAEFEDIQSSLKFSFGDAWKGIYDQALGESKHLAFTFKQTSDLVANLGKVGINVFGTVAGEVEKFRSKTGESIGALDVLQDTLSGTGLSMQEAGRLMRGVHEAIIGNFREFKMGLAMPPKLIDEMKHKIASAGTDMQKRFEGVIEVLSKFYGGATKLKELNLSFQIQQLADKWELLKGAIAGPGLRIVTEGLKKFVDALQDLLNNKDAMEGLVKGFKVLETIISWLFVAAEKVVAFTASILSLMPWLPPLAAGLALAAVAGGAVIFAAFGIAAGLTAMAVAVVALEAAIDWPILLALAALFPVLLVTIGAVIVVVGSLTAAIGLLVWGGMDALQKKGEGVYTIFDKMRVLFSAFSQLITSYNGETSEMSKETADDLSKMGLLDFVTDSMTYLDRLMTAWESFKDTLSMVGDYIGPTFMPMLEEIGQFIYDIADALGLINGVAGANKTSFDDWADAGEELGMDMLKLTNYIIAFMRSIVQYGEAGLLMIHRLRAEMGNVEEIAKVKEIEDKNKNKKEVDPWKEAEEKVGKIEGDLEDRRRKRKLKREVDSGQQAEFDEYGNIKGFAAAPAYEAPPAGPPGSAPQSPMVGMMGGGNNLAGGPLGGPKPDAGDGMEKHTAAVVKAFSEMSKRPLVANISLDGQELKNALTRVDVPVGG